MREQRDSNGLLWHGLHIALGLSLPLIVLLLMGCMKAGAKGEDLGPAVDPNKIDSILAQQINSTNFNNLAVGNYVDYTDTRRIDDDDTDIPLGARHIDVLDRQDTTTQAKFTFRITESVLQNDGSFLNVVSEDSLLLDKTSVQLSPSVAAQDVTPTPAGAQTVTFHNLVEYDTTMDPPAAVKGRPGCGGLSPCSLNVHVVQFDMAIWSDSTDYQKISMNFVFTAQTPYLPYGSDFNQLTGLLISDCRSTMLTVDGQIDPVYVRDCSILDDFSQ